MSLFQSSHWLDSDLRCQRRESSRQRRDNRTVPHATPEGPVYGPLAVFNGVEGQFAVDGDLPFLAFA
jgi:hypothetical protein